MSWSRIGIVVGVCAVFVAGLLLIVFNLPTRRPPHEAPFPATDPVTLPTPSGSGTP